MMINKSKQKLIYEKKNIGYLLVITYWIGCIYVSNRENGIEGMEMILSAPQADPATHTGSEVRPQIHRCTCSNIFV